jgi:hypothetical protein
MAIRVIRVINGGAVPLCECGGRRSASASKCAMCGAYEKFLAVMGPEPLRVLEAHPEYAAIISSAFSAGWNSCTGAVLDAAGLIGGLMEAGTR